MPGKLRQGDCVAMLREEVADDSIDALVTDPPAGIEFMGREWDSFRDRPANASGPQTDAWHDNGGRNPYARKATPRFTGKEGTRAIPIRENFIAFMTEVAAECYRVMKPGAHGLVWAIPRTSHWTATALEDAGFEVRDVVTHHFGTGFPKSLDVAKAIDKAAGVEGQYGEPKTAAHAGWIERGRMRGEEGHEGYQRPWMQDTEAVDRNARQYLPSTEEAAQWQGWGTALKPASEHWILVRKPFKGTVAANVLANGTGALNIDGCRIATSENPTAARYQHGFSEQAKKALGSVVASESETGFSGEMRPVGNPSLGRWPANLVLSHAPDCRQIGVKKVRSASPSVPQPDFRQVTGRSTHLDAHARIDATSQGYADENGTETVEAWECVEGCPVAELDRQSGIGRDGVAVRHRGVLPGHVTPRAKPPGTPDMGYGGEGGASRFFYVAKASTSERNAGLEDFERKLLGTWDGAEDDLSDGKKPTRPRANHHPTVKSIALMRWLCRLVTPPGGWVLDPFMGSGSTGVAAVREGFNFFGIEREPDYYAIAEARILHAAREAAEVPTE